MARQTKLIAMDYQLRLCCVSQVRWVKYVGLPFTSLVSREQKGDEGEVWPDIGEGFGRQEQEEVV